MLCPYDADRVGPQTLAEAEASHPQLIDASGARASTGFAPDRIDQLGALPHDNQLCSSAMGPGFTFDATNAALAGQFACDHAVRLGLGGDHAELKLIVGELVARSLVPGVVTGTLRIWAERGYLVCEVRHSGHLNDSFSTRPLTESSRPAGRDLLLVNHLSDLVQQRTYPQGTSTRVYLKLPPVDGSPSDPRKSVVAPQRTRPAPPASPTPLPWQTYEALHAAERFGRYLPQDVSADVTRLTAASGEARPVEPVLEALTAVEKLARVVDRWRARLVRLARARGAPWTDIGQALGVSKQAAHERYGRARSRPTGGAGLPGQACPPPIQGT